MLARACLLALLPIVGAIVSVVHAQDFSNVQIEQVGKGFHFTEGPVWSRDGYLIFSDIPVNKILQLAPPATEKEQSHAAVLRADSGGGNGNTLDVRGRLYTCEGHARRVTRRDKKGKIEVLADAWQGKRLNSPNDIVVRHDEQVYFTDPAFGSAVDSRELDFYGIFHITPKGELSVVAKWPTRPNGVALSPDGKTLYVADSDRHTIHTFDLDRVGNAANDRVFLSAISGVPDGLRTDEKGNLYVAANSVFIYSPEGKMIGEVPIGETPSNCAFGGEDFTTLYITARTSIYRTNLKVKGSVQY
jgi:gluconolactonase